MMFVYQYGIKKLSGSAEYVGLCVCAPYIRGLCVSVLVFIFMRCEKNIVQVL